MRDRTGVAVLAALLVVGTAAAAYAEIAVSANDAKLKLINGKAEVQKSPPPDTVTFIDLRATPPKVLAEIEVPNSVVGPPTNVAVSPKEDIALVASSMQIDPADPDQADPRRQADGHRPVAAEAEPRHAASARRSELRPRGRRPCPRSSPRCRPAREPPASPSTRPAPWRWWPTVPRGRSPCSRSAARP